MELDTILVGDSAVVLKTLPDESVDLTVTSPPYDNLRAYKGFVFDFEAIARELYRVTKQGGVVVWVVGDATVNGSETGTSFKQALFFKECGFNLHDTMIYQRKTAPLTHNRYEQEFEYMFVLSKQKPKTVNHIRVPTVHFGKDKGIIGKNRQSHDASSSIVNEFRIKGNVWQYAVGGRDTGHPAVFPEQLAHDHIISWSNEGDTVLDCFTGSGTTLKMAKLLNRHYIGIEIAPEYAELAQKRIDALHEQTELK